jgi:hypothetical protein
MTIFLIVKERYIATIEYLIVAKYNPPFFKFIYFYVLPLPQHKIKMLANLFILFLHAKPSFCK